MPGVDPLLEPKLTPELCRVVNAEQSYRFFREVSPTIDAFPDPDAPETDPDGEFVFVDMGRTDENFVSSRMHIVNDGANSIEFSFDGVTVHGILHGGESLTEDERQERRVFIRNLVGGSTTTVRVWAW